MNRAVGILFAWIDKHDDRWGQGWVPVVILAIFFAAIALWTVLKA